MDRRRFLNCTGAALGTGLFSPLASCTAQIAAGPAGGAAHGGGGEFRAAWIATVHNLDWPSARGLGEGTLRAQLTGLIESLHAANLNAVVFQVRPAADAIYRSGLEPWAPWLTGRMGGDPGFDPLEHAIDEAHRRGMELHAWFNPFRALASNRFQVPADHVTRRHPEWVRRMGNHVWLDPGLPEVRRYSLSVITDVCRRYDIDGVHFDDYFYPYPIAGRSFPDDASFSRHGSGNRLAWRRDNVNTFVRDAYHAVHQVKPQAKFGISPFGIWRPGVPTGIEAGLDAYDQLAADARFWLQRGWVDYLAPQLYWADGGPQSFSALLAWWQSQNTLGRHLWPGLDITAERGHSQAQIVRQINFTRGIRGIPAPGQIFWAARNIRNNRAGLADVLRNQIYRQRVPVPACPWL